MPSRELNSVKCSTGISARNRLCACTKPASLISGRVVQPRERHMRDEPAALRLQTEPLHRLLDLALQQVRAAGCARRRPRATFARPALVNVPTPASVNANFLPRRVASAWSMSSARCGVDLADEAQRQVIVLVRHPARAGDAAAAERSRAVSRNSQGRSSPTNSLTPCRASASSFSTSGRIRATILRTPSGLG